ncbi:Twin-arginine translocation protein TatB [hydrothermal vent metagenome]|uniref:Twin-arginine translocation protein TatB n=1 Tax=hydrothermal vent metagenome TaxID=652676 RepID=A0A1W1C4H8_9ZZZZ
MFGLGFTEILFIAIVAILFLGPDKLPGAMVDIAKFIKNMKTAIGEAKKTLDEEVNIEELKREAMSYKEKLDEANQELQGFKNLNPMNEVKAEFGSVKDNFARLTQIDTSEPEATPQPTTTQVEPKQSKEVTFKKKTVKQDEGIEK